MVNALKLDFHGFNLLWTLKNAYNINNALFKLFNKICVFCVPFCKPVKRRRCVLQLTDFIVGETRSRLRPLMWWQCDVEFKVLDSKASARHKQCNPLGLLQLAICCARGVCFRSERKGVNVGSLSIFSTYGYFSPESISLRKKALSKEYMDTYESTGHLLVLSNTSTQFRGSEQDWRNTVFMIKYQNKALLYRHFYIIVKYMFTI